MEYSSKKANGWVEATTNAHEHRLAGFTFNPTPLDLQSNRNIRAAGLVLDALDSAEFQTIVRPLRALDNNLTSNIVAVLKKTVLDNPWLDVGTTVSHVSAIQSELDGYIESRTNLDAAHIERLYSVVDDVTREIKAFLRGRIEEATAGLEYEKEVGFSRLPGAPTAKALHELYYPDEEQTPSPWERFASESDRRPINSESADIVGAPREDVPVVEYVYAHEYCAVGDDETSY